MNTITYVHAREILDSRGNPTVEVEMGDGEHLVRAAVPSGASTGKHEALELRDKDPARYGGKGVLKAVGNVEKVLGPGVMGLDPANQKALDQVMLDLDGTKNKSLLGANAILGVSLAAARLAAVQKGVPLWKHINDLFGGKVSIPCPMMNILNGGVHADSGLAIQEFMILPQGKDFPETLRMGAEIFHTLKKILKANKQSVGVGDEGGYAPKIATAAEALETIMEAIDKAGYAGRVNLALDAAANEFCTITQGCRYVIDGKTVTCEELVDYYGDLLEQFPIRSIEDSHSEDDEMGFQLMQKRFGKKIQLVGDDLLVTNPEKLRHGIQAKLGNAILIKVNQIGTLSETLETIQIAKDAGWATVVSHRSGETADSFIADLAVGTDAGQIKTGSLSRGERVEKYNQLLRIGEEL